MAGKAGGHEGGAPGSNHDGQFVEVNSIQSVFLIYVAVVILWFATVIL